MPVSLLRWSALLLAVAAVDVYVMMPLNTVSNQGTLRNPDELKTQLQTLRSSGVDGIMIDVWWKLIEPSAGKYDFTPYVQLFQICSSVGLKVQPVTSFHKCGGNVGDACDISLPDFVTSVAQGNPNVYYKDAEGHYDSEYLSLGVDNEALFGGRTPIQMYSGVFGAMAKDLIAPFRNITTGVQVSMGPAGELRYPSYQLQYWSFCGIGEFQSYDKYMLANLKAYAQQQGHPEWGGGPPNNAGSYNNHPSDTGFFANGNDNYASDYGKFFLTWYSQQLLQHGASVLKAAKAQFKDVPILGKVSGVHWWYKDPSHAAELTAGYYNANGQDAYAAIANLFKTYGAAFDFTCMEMKDSEQQADCLSGPEELVQQTKKAALGHGVAYGGENALPRYDNTAYDQIKSQASGVDAFYYLRLGPDLLKNIDNFKQFVSGMHGISRIANTTM